MISGNFALTYSTVKSGPCCACMPGGTAKQRNCGRISRAILLISALSSGDHIDAQNFHAISTRSMRTRLVTHHYVRPMVHHKRSDIFNFYESKVLDYAVRLDIKRWRDLLSALPQCTMWKSARTSAVNFAIILAALSGAVLTLSN
jgi:hypothetical protein